MMAKMKVIDRNSKRVYILMAAWFGAIVGLILLPTTSCSEESTMETGLMKNPYMDGRPFTPLRMDADDQGVVLKHGGGPGDCDMYGARDVWVFEHNGTYYMHYDGAGPTAWLSCLAVSKDLTTWDKKGPILDIGKKGEDDSGSASYGTTYNDGHGWHMFYLGTPNTTPPPDRVPAFPYLTMKAKAASPIGPWVKQPDVVPFRCKPGTYYDVTASPGFIIKHNGEYLQFLSVTKSTDADHEYVLRTLSIARTKDLNGLWTIDPKPLVPSEEQVENSSLYFEPSYGTWFLFTNHVGIASPDNAYSEDVTGGAEYTDAVWVYWSKDPNRWDPKNKAVVLDPRNCAWSKTVVGLPSVLKVGDRLAVFYDGLAEPGISHMRRDIGLAWLELPLRIPSADTPAK